MNTTPEHLDQVFFALSDATRRGILAQLASGETTVGDLARPYDISAPAISKHLRILERAGLVQRSRQGRQHRCSLSTAGLRTAEDWLSFHRSFWENTLDSLEDMLSEVE